MPAKAFNLRGTNGSGKTHVARALIKASNAMPYLYEGRKVRSYMGSLDNRDIIILGSYETQCGGCDTIPSVSIVADLLDKYMQDPAVDLVFYEGLMISHMIGTVGAMVKKYNEHHVMGFLDTPLDTCIDRVVARRLERGDTRPFDPKNIIADHPRVQGARRNALAQGFQVVDILHEHAVEEVLDHVRTLSAAA